MDLFALLDTVPLWLLVLILGALIALILIARGFSLPPSYQKNQSRRKVIKKQLHEMEKQHIEPVVEFTEEESTPKS